MSITTNPGTRDGKRVGAAGSLDPHRFRRYRCERNGRLRAQLERGHASAVVRLKKQVERWRSSGMPLERIAKRLRLTVANMTSLGYCVTAVRVRPSITDVQRPVADLTPRLVKQPSARKV